MNTKTSNILLPKEEQDTKVTEPTPVILKKQYNKVFVILMTLLTAISLVGCSSSSTNEISKTSEQKRHKSPIVKNIGGNISTATNAVTPVDNGLPNDAMNENQRKIYDACNEVGSPGSGLCAMWVSQVYNKAGFGYPTGNANDMYYAYCHSSNKSELKVGMCVAVPTHNKTSAGATYGHIGIYIGDGKIMENVGHINTRDLDDWISFYGEVAEVKWGFAADGIA